jgi:hypothetical protein
MLTQRIEAAVRRRRRDDARRDHRPAVPGDSVENISHILNDCGAACS